MTIDMTQFYQVFFEESEEHLAAMESLLLGLDLEQPDSEDLNAIFRAAHSIKGSSGTFGFTDLAEVTHILESLLDRLRKNELVLRADMVDAFLAAGDLLKTMLAAHRRSEADIRAGLGDIDPQAVAAVCARLNQLVANTSPAAVVAPPPAPVAVAQALAQPPVSQALCSYDIEFVPTDHAARDPRIIPDLFDEFRRYGDLQILIRPDASLDGGGYWHLRLSTDQSAEHLGESIDFIAEQDAWRIKVCTSAAAPDSAGESGESGVFGLFEGAAGSPSVDEGFGLFDGAPGASGPAEVMVVGDESEGYGFFAPLPESPENQPLAAPLLEEEGDGFGLFAPLPEPVVVPPAPVVVEEAPLPDPPPPPRAPVKSSAGATVAAAESSSIRVGVEKVDQLVNLVGELVITQAMLLQCAGQLRGVAPERLTHGLAQLERNVRDLQESVMSIRMLPISFVFSRFPRVVRDLSAKLGKQIELKMSGETTELDKGLIEKIADPLTHLIRNSLDHGIERPEQRIAAGKSPTGTITLRAAHQGGNIVIEVGDDGAGLSRRRILDKARERGFQVSEQMSDQEVWMLIFEAGFSTADAVTDVSGRGVGMDVVRRNIQAMGGRVEIESMAGVGTRMTVRLPLTLAILDGMSVAVGEQTYILPLSYVIESLQPEPQDVKTLSNQARVILVRGEYLPVIVLHEIFGIAPKSAGFAQGIMVVLDADGTRAALFVDALIGQHQVVIKSLENNFRRVAGISGATIMGDGHVALILDISALAAMAKSAQIAAL